MTQTVLMRVVAGTLHLAEDPLAEGSTDIDVLRKALWQKFYFGADRLLDMMVLIQEQAKTESEQNKKVWIVSVVGGGGVSISFSPPFPLNTLLASDPSLFPPENHVIPPNSSLLGPLCIPTTPNVDSS